VELAAKLAGQPGVKQALVQILVIVDTLCKYDEAPDVFSLNESIADKVIEEKSYCF